MPCSGVDVHQAAVRPPRQSACGLRESEAPVGVELSSTAALEGPVGKVVGAGAGVARSAGLEMPRVCGSVARWLAAGELGRNRGPFCPQAARDAAQAPRAMHLTRICEAFNISEL
ncbi:hypothetical protein HQS1_10540 [Delftia lacustris]|nr:hypothetical protein HQS1_10540 [Delftia lacustris]